MHFANALQSPNRILYVQMYRYYPKNLELRKHCCFILSPITLEVLDEPLSQLSQLNRAAVQACQST
jgi:hypothetical protein